MARAVSSRRVSWWMLLRSFSAAALGQKGQGGGEGGGRGGEDVGHVFTRQGVLVYVWTRLAS